jgi:uncharacterized protein
MPFVGGDIRRSRMTQRGVDTRVEFRRGEASPVRRPQEPQRPFPYDERDVRFAGYSSTVQLSGTLTVPRGGGPHPAMLISGSMDEYRTIEQTIADDVFAVLDSWLRRHVSVSR